MIFRRFRKCCEFQSCLTQRAGWRVATFRLRASFRSKTLSVSQAGSRGNPQLTQTVRHWLPTFFAVGLSLKLAFVFIILSIDHKKIVSGLYIPAWSFNRFCIRCGYFSKFSIRHFLQIWSWSIISLASGVVFHPHSSGGSISKVFGLFHACG